jgi:Ca2+-binding EF-hand superfamily protein
MNRMHCVLCLCSGLCCGAPRAQQDAEQLRAAFQRLDADRDGVLARKEFPGSDRQFAELDADKDGVATLDEYAASPVGRAFLRARYRAQQEPRPRVTAEALAPSRLLLLSRADRNHDGKVARDEWTGTAEAFVQLDLDADGVLDRRDQVEAAAQAPPPPPALPEPKGDLPSGEEWLRRFDKDGDGRLSQAEVAAQKFLAAALPMADTDGDGALSAAELRALEYALQRRRDEQTRDRGRPVPFEVPFDTWDKDKDGRVRQNEWQGSRALFDRIDLDRDAAVSREEVARYQKRTTGEDFVARFDLDGDGKVSAAEFAGPPGAFRRADRNGDGVVTRGDR